jgi:retron-type reverse transcriptase
LTLFPVVDKDKIILDLFQAYFDARKNKRNTINALAFEKHFEANVFSLCDEILENRYEPKPSICFIVDKPVKREIFAADFRDRVVHHFICNYIFPVFEKVFINDSYSCRKGKGTHYGIKRIGHFIRSCSQNYTSDCYILKLDINSTSKVILWQ